MVLINRDLVVVKHEPQLAALARAVISSKRTHRPVESILIAGDTVRLGSDDYNLQLARRRAREVQSELAEDFRRLRISLSRHEPDQVRDRLLRRTETQGYARSKPPCGIFLRTSVPPPPRPTQLRPGRWRPILSAALSPNAKLRTGNAVRSLIDGRETLEEMVSDIRATNGEADYVYLLAWDVTDNFALIPGDPSSTFRRLMADAQSRRGVQIRAMLWAKPPGLNLLEKFAESTRLPMAPPFATTKRPTKLRCQEYAWPPRSWLRE